MPNLVLDDQFIQQQRRFPRHLIGDFTFELHQRQSRPSVFLSRNLERSLQSHQKRREEQIKGAALKKFPSAGSRRQEGVSAEKPPTSAPKQTLASVGERVRDLAVSDTVTSKPPTNQALPTQPQMSSRASLSSSGSNMEQNRRSSRRSIRGLLDRPFEQPEAELVFDFSSIRKKLNFRTNNLSENERPAKRQKRDVIKCYCHLTVWDNRENQGATPLSSKSHYCRVTTTETVSDGVIVDIDLDTPFLIKADELKVPIKTEHGSILGIIENYFLELKIIPCKNDSRWPPIPVLGKSDGDHARETRRNGTEELQGALVARYTHLPQAPEPDVPLSVFYLREGRTFRSKYGLQVSCSWENSRGRSRTIRPKGAGLDLDSFLSNSTEKATQQTKPAESLRSAYSTRPGLPEVRYDICREKDVIFRVCTVQGYKCPLCTLWTTSKLEHLQFHFMTSHSKYSFSVQNPKRNLAAKDTAQVQIRVEAIRDEEDEDESREFHWQLPAAPLNLPSFLSGNDSWLGLSTPKPSLPDAPIPGTETKRPASGYSLAVDVPDFREPRPRKYKVIKVQSRDSDSGEYIFTSRSHRPVSPSEDDRSDTDDEIDNTWQINVHMERLDQLAKRQGWNPFERELFKRWDKHRTEERLEHPRYLSNSLIRFARKQRAWLRGGTDELLAAFCDLLDRLKVQRVIDDDVICDVNELIFADPPTTNTATSEKTTARSGASEPDMPGSRSRQRNGTNSITAHDSSMGPPTPASTDGGQEAPAPAFTCGHCSKGVAKHFKNAVLCANPECATPRQFYHRRCVKHLQEQAERADPKGKQRAEPAQAPPAIVPQRQATATFSGKGTGAKVQIQTDFEVATWICPDCMKRHKAKAEERVVEAGTGARSSGLRTVLNADTA